MPIMLEELRHLIEMAFPNADTTRIYQDQTTLYIQGQVTWEGFRGMDCTDRHALASRRVRDGIGLRGLNVGLIACRCKGERHIIGLRDPA